MSDVGPTLPNRIVRRVALAVAPALIVLGVVLPAASASAVSYVACGDVTGVSGLVNSIDLGNRYGGGTVTIQLTPGCTYVVPEPAWTYDSYGNKIYTDSAFYQLNDTIGKHNVLVVEGNGATITRGSSAGRIRFFDIGYQGEVVLKNLTITGGLSPHGSAGSSSPGQDGGAILNAGNLTLQNVTITGNAAGNGENGNNGGSGSGDPGGDGGNGGGISNTGTLTISGSTISNNLSGSGGSGGNGLNGGQGGTGGDGGGIYNRGSLSVTTSTVTGNSTGVGGSGGSGVYGAPPSYRGSGGGVGSSGGTVTVTRSLFSSNDAEGTMAAQGGAIEMTQGANLVVENSTFTGNKAWRGGALHVSGGTAAIRSSTFTGNDATGTGDDITGDVAAMDNGSTMTFANTLMTGNDSGQVDCNTQVTGAAVHYSSLGGLMSDENSGCGTNTVITDPKLEALGAWGGPTASRLPKSGSPALGAGVAASCLPVDQRGAVRPASGCDIGAVERVAVSAPGAITGPVVVPLNQAKPYATTASSGGAPLEYRWSVGGVAATMDSTTSATPQITFTGSGIATVHLNVRIAGTSDSESTDLPGLTVKVPPAGNAPPQIAWSGAAVTAANEGDTKRFSFSVSEPDGDAVTFSFGSPSCGTGGVLVGSQLLASSGYVDCSFPNGPASPVVKVQVEDSWAAASSVTTTVAVAEVAPTINVLGNATPDEGSVADYVYTIHEPGSDTFTPVTTCTGPGVTKVSGSDHYTGGLHDTSGSFQCRFGNGPSTASATVTANGGSGSVTAAVKNVAPTISVSGPNPAAENGSTNTTYRYELNAVDPGDMASLTVVPGSPSCGGPGVGVVVGYDSTAIVCRFMDGPATAFVTSTLQDPDGATSSGGGLAVQITNVAPTVTVGQPTGSAAEGSTVYFPLTATDPGLDTLTVTAPTGCTANFIDTSTQGRLTALMACVYPDGPATVSRTVKVYDGTAYGSATIANQQVLDVDPTIAAAFTGWDSWEGGSATLRVGGITDPGQDTPTSIIVHWGDGASQTFSWPLLSTDLVHSYGQEGEYFATIDVVDEDGTHTNSSGNQRIVVHNSPPSAYLTAPSSTPEGVPTTITYTVSIGTQETYSINLLQCGHDLAYNVIAPTNLIQGPSGGSFSCSWPVGNQDQTILLRVTDSGGITSGDITAIVHVANVPVVVAWTSGPTAVYEDQVAVHRYTFHASDNGSLGMTLLTYSLYGGLTVMYGCGDGGTVVSQVSNHYGGTMPGVVFDPATGDGYIDCTFVKGPATARVQVDVSDYQSETVATFDVTVVNAAPSVTVTGPVGQVPEGQPAVFTYTTSDPSGEQVDPSTIDCGPHGTLDSQSTGTFGCTYDDGPADYAASITVTDGTATATGSAPVHVANVAPTAIALAGSQFFDLGVPYELTLGAVTDPGKDTVSSWTVHWGDGTTSVLSSNTPNPTHDYVDPDPHTITVDVTDEDGTYLALGSKDVLQADHVPPVLTVPGDVTMEGNGTDGLYWQWPRSAVDARDGDLPVVCTGPTFYGYDFFYVGSTRYDCSATDAAGNRSEASFTVTVVDTTAPTFAPVNLGHVNATSPAGAVVSWNTTASDKVDWQVGGVCDTAPGQLFAFGSYSVHCTATDRAGNVGVLDFSFEVGDFVGPAIAPVAEVDVDATGPHGAVATYATPTAWDTLDGAVPVNCSPESGGTFPLGDTTVTCASTDSSHNTSTATFLVRVRDVGLPVVTPPADMLVAPTGPDGAVVTFDAPTATDAIDPQVTASCAPASGALFPLGVTNVQCSATDASGNVGMASFTVTVQDAQAPVVTPPADIVVEATGQAGETVTYTGEAAIDLVDGPVPVSCAATSGTVFHIGTTTVTCTATDSQNNVGTATFTVSIVDTTKPVVTSPADLTIEATGPSTVATFSGASAVDLVDGSVPTSCAPASGSAFGFGNTTVTCSARDAHGNTGKATFTVSVVDHTPPVVSGANVTVGATSPAGAVVHFTPTATDLVDGALVPNCTPSSGALFASETTTTVTCTATDLNGNTGTGSFTVTVHGAVFTTDAAARDTEVPVSLNIFAPGDYVVIDQGAADQEVRYVQALGSIVFAAPLAHAHPAGTMVSVIKPPPLGDTEAPTITITALGTLGKGSVVTADVHCSDQGVGVEECEVPAIDTSTTGSHTVTVRAWDFNGNLSTQSLSYTVVVSANELGATGIEVGGTMYLALLLLLSGLAVLMIRRRSTRSGRVSPPRHGLE
ncbi:MAG: Ig-like domain (Group 3) [Glaciihabitans sp.]|nr:Ig-like domain (Group 3) [Glaciihabitans sp.]